MAQFIRTYGKTPLCVCLIPRGGIEESIETQREELGICVSPPSLSLPLYPTISPLPLVHLPFSPTFTSLSAPLYIFLSLPLSLSHTLSTPLLCLDLSPSHTHFLTSLYVFLSPSHTLTHSLSTSPLCLPLSPSHILINTLSIPPLCLPMSSSHTLIHTLSIPPLCLPLSPFHTLTHSLSTSTLCLPLSTYPLFLPLSTSPLFPPISSSHTLTNTLYFPRFSLYISLFLSFSLPLFLLLFSPSSTSLSLSPYKGDSCITTNKGYVKQRNVAAPIS